MTLLFYSLIKTLLNKTNIVNNELKEVSNWFKANKLSINASKTNFMILGTSFMTSKIQSDLKISLNNTQLDRVTSTKFLGIIVDENLTWKNHINCTSKTISRNIGVINKLKHFIPYSILRTLYCTLILPYLNYGVVIWGKTCKSYLDKIVKLQKWAIRSITNSHFRSHTAPLFLKSNLLNINDMYTLELGVFTYRFSINDLPVSFKDYFKRRSDIHKYKTRHTNDLQLTNNKKAFSDQCIRSNGPVLWNSLPQNIKESKSIKHFRNQFKRYLLQAYE